MKVTKSMKLQSPTHEYSSVGWEFELSPEDLGLPSPPYTLQQAREILAALRKECQIQCCGAMVAEGAMSKEEFFELCGNDNK